MERSRLRKASLSQNEDARPGEPAFLAPAGKDTPPECKHPIPRHTQTREVSRYRVVVEVALYDRLEPLSVWGTGSCMRSRSCCLTCRSLARMRLRIVVRRTMNRPNPFFALMCVKPSRTFPACLPLFVPGFVRQTDDHHLALRILLAPDVHPEITPSPRIVVALWAVQWVQRIKRIKRGGS
jgi:hypothetical protein